MNYKVPLLVLAIALGSVLTWWLQNLRENFDEERAPVAGGPNHSLDNAVMTVMDESGAPQYRLESPRLAHYGEDGHAELESPRMLYFRPEGPPLKLRSERAHIAADGKLIRLQGRVHVLRPAAGERPALTIDTRNVNVWPKPRTASTEEEAIAVNGPYRIRGLGMQADLDAGTVKLLSEVRSVYEP